MGQAAAACCGERFDCDLKFGSLKPRTKCDPAGRAVPALLLPHTMGTNSIAGSLPEPVIAQLYHHETPGLVAVGANAAFGAALAAIPRLQPIRLPAVPASLGFAPASAGGG